MTRVLTAADPVAELLRLAAELDDTTQEVADQPDVTSRLPAVLNAVWALQGRWTPW